MSENSSTNRQLAAPRIRLLEMILPGDYSGSRENCHDVASGRWCAAAPETIGVHQTLSGRVRDPVVQADSGRFEQLVCAILKRIDPTIVEDADCILLATAVGEIELISRELHCKVRPFVDLYRISACPEVPEGFARAQVVASGCAAGLDALGLALDYVGSGVFGSVLVLAVDAPLCPVIVGGFRSAGTMTKARTVADFRGPFDKQRGGFYLGEAAVAVLVEQKRGELGVDDCRLLGWESVSSAYHMTGMRESGEDLYRVCQSALARAGVSAVELDWICSHGSGTRMNDEIEALVVGRLAEPRSIPIPVCGFKGVYGHCLGAANLIDVGVCIRSCVDGGIPPLGMVRSPIQRDGVRPMTESLPVGNSAVWLTMASSFSGIHTAMVIGWNR